MPRGARLPRRSTTAALIASLLLTTTLAGCLAPVTREDVRIEAKDADGDGRTGWHALTLAPEADQGLDRSATQVMYQAPDADGFSPLCWSTELAVNSCRETFSAGQTWAPGETLYFPCRHAGPTELEITYHGRVILEQTITHTLVDETVGCDQAV